MRIEPLIPKEFIPVYAELKERILKRLRKRHDFLKEVDEALIDALARLYAHWLFIEACLKEDVGARERLLLIQSWRTVDGMLNEKLAQLAITPALRKRIAEDLMEEDEVARRLRQLVEGVRQA